MSFDLSGAIDLHAHCAPDVRPRKTTAVELVRLAKAAGMRGILLKNHQLPTTSLAATLAEVEAGMAVFGGIVLNDAVGGLNPAAVESALRMGAAEVWMPTHCAEQERAYRGKPGTGLTILDGDGRVVEPVREICKLVAEADAILGTAHLGAEEVRALIAVGRDCGVRKFLVNHPEIDFLKFSVAFQKEVAGAGVWFERCYARAGFALDWDGLAGSIREVGVASTVLATDLGQPANPDPVSGLREMGEQLASRGFSRRELHQMMCENPARLLGLEG